MMTPTLSKAKFNLIAQHIESTYGISMPEDKLVLIKSRLTKRAMELGCNTIDDYVDLVLQKNAVADEVERMINMISTHLTSFFRESAHFDQLLNLMVPQLLQDYPASYTEPLLVWSAACSTGQEVYSLAMALAAGQDTLHHSLRRRYEFAVFGSDLSPAAVDYARTAIYSPEEVASVPRGAYGRFLMHTANRERYRIVPELRRRTYFRVMNLMERPYPIVSPVHIIFCRNVLIYFNIERRNRVLHALVDTLVPGGFLVLGHAESIMHCDMAIEQVAPTIYRKMVRP
jgi:chemotaxis protein methyltransferase CheR